MIRRSLLLLSCGAISLFSCKKSGDDSQKLREMSEVVVENDNDIQAYLKSQYCELDADKNIVLGTLAGNTGKTSLEALAISPAIRTCPFLQASVAMLRVL